MTPDILDVIMARFANPTNPFAGLGVSVAKIAEKTKKEST
jgi:hypothetical protein